LIIKKIFNKLYLTIFAYLDHVGYAKHIGVKMGNNVNIYGNPSGMFGTEPWCITLGNNVHITREVLFVTHDGGTLLFRHLEPDLEITAPIKVGDYVYIGVRSIIMPGVSIGNNVIIAAGSIVTRDIPDNSVYGGVPAKFIKSTNDYLEKIKLNSLKIGHLIGKQKDRELRKILNTNNNKFG
jgi:acetyltransferase-like isoleucine patch superfamily enzyme